MSSPDVPPDPLEAADLAPDPFTQFAVWFAAAAAAGVHEPEAVALATAAGDGRPSVRMVLLRGHGPDGFVWYTNYESRKGDELGANPVAALVAHWAPIGRQVRIEGPVSRTSPEVSDAYFASRDRASQLGAWASRQSRPLRDRAELDARLSAVTERFADGDVPRPPSWGGYVLAPTAVEFWQHGANRLHDRFRYELNGGTWTVGRLSP